MEKESGYNMEVQEKFQRVIDMIEERFFTSKGKRRFPPFALAINDRCRRSVGAYVCSNSLFDTSKGKRVQYLALNPRYFKDGAGKILQTLVHELCHVYENAYIHVPRGGYHDRQWADLMRDCGLEPAYLNRSRTAVNQTVIEGGEFGKFLDEFERDNPGYFTLVEYTVGTVEDYRRSNPDEEVDGEDARADNADKPLKRYNRNKTKYVCSCGNKVWGKAGLHVRCEDCTEEFAEEEQ